MVMLFVAVIVLISVTMIVSMPALLGVAQLQQPFAWVVGEGVHSSGARCKVSVRASRNIGGARCGADSLQRGREA